jgi:hypothetical protein
MRSFFLVALCGLLACADASAQMSRSRERSGSPRDHAPKETASPQGAPAYGDGLAALERELPSLKVDLQLKAEQVNAWSVFERDVRDAAEMDRARRKHAMAVRNADESHKTALAVVNAIAEDDRVRSEISADLRKHLEALYQTLDTTQRTLLDRRVVMSQTDPIGNAAPAR